MRDGQTWRASNGNICLFLLTSQMCIIHPGKQKFWVGWAHPPEKALQWKALCCYISMLPSEYHSPPLRTFLSYLFQRHAACFLWGLLISEIFFLSYIPRDFFRSECYFRAFFRTNAPNCYPTGSARVIYQPLTQMAFQDWTECTHTFGSEQRLSQ